MEPIDYSDLIGLPYKAEINDCFQIGRRYFAKLGIELRDYAFPSNFWNYDDSLYEKHFAEEGFVRVDEENWTPQIHDVLLVRGAQAASFPTHVGILVGPNQVLHHYTNRFSEVVPFRGHWRRPPIVLRHKSVTLQQPELAEVRLVDLMPDHVKRRFEGLID